MILHTINKPGVLASCFDLISEKDAVVLLEDGIYLSNQIIPGKVYAIEADLLARGIKLSASNRIKVIDYPRFVELTIEASKTCAWF